MIEKKPFVPYRTEEERGKEKSTTKTIRENLEESARLEEWKELLDVKSDGEAYKIAVVVALNVVQRTFGDAFTRRLFKRERLRLSDFKSFQQ